MPGIPISFEDLETQAQTPREAGDKAGLLALADSTRAAAVTGAPGAVNLALWLARLQVDGIRVQEPENGRIWVKEEQREPLVPLLERIAALRGTTSCTHRSSTCSCRCIGMGRRRPMPRYGWLLKACLAMPDYLDYLDKFRGAVLTLKDQDGYEDDELIEPRLVEQLGDIMAVLGEVIDAALEGAGLEETRLRLQVYRTDWEFRTAEPWDYAATARRARRLGTLRGDETGGTRTPDAWAFMWELRWPHVDGFFAGALGLRASWRRALFRR